MKLFVSALEHRSEGDFEGMKEVKEMARVRYVI